MVELSAGVRVRAPLRWAGSKRALLPTLLRNVPGYSGTYVEPFFGSGCLYFALAPSRAVLGDFNADLVNFYRSISANPDDVYDAFDEWASDPDTYYRVRGLPVQDLSSTARAARFFYLNRLSFNGVYRTNRRGEFNVPIGRNTGKPPSRQDLREAAECLRSAEVHLGDYRATLSEVKHDDFVYLDPPYVNESRRSYGEYGYGSFGHPDDVGLLADELTRLQDLGAKVLFSFGSSVGLERALEGWTVMSVLPKQSVAGKISSRRANDLEILARNYEI